MSETYDWSRRHEKKRPAAPPIVQLAPITAGQAAGDASYGRAALTREAENVGSALEGTRNDTLNTAAFNLAQLVASGHLADLEVRQALTDAARHVGLDEHEIQATIQSGFRAGGQQPRNVQPLTINGTVTEVADINGHQPGPQQPDDDESEPRDRTSWWPKPIGQRAAESAEEPKPTHLVRDDGEALMYSGKVNGLIGESESGKSWIALLAVVQALQDHQRVLVLDFEDSPAGIHGRLELLGCSPEQLEQLHYANPDESLGVAQSEDLQEALTGHYQLIVADGVNAAMTLLGYDLNSNTDATLFNRKLLKPLASSGACVITVDHVPKNSEQRGKGGIGAQAKRAMMDGACLTVEVVDPFGKGQHGTLKLKVDKDRPGYVRGVSSGSVLAARAHLSSTDEQVTLRIAAPDMRPVSERGTFRPTALMEKVSRCLEGLSDPIGSNDIVTAVGSRKDNVLKAIAALVEDGHIEVTSGPNRSKRHASVQPYRQVDDPASDWFVTPNVTVVPGGSQVVPGTSEVVVPDPPLPMGAGTTPRPEEQPVVPGTTDIPDGHSSCNHCGQSTPDHIIEETSGYCRDCGRRFDR